ncbi:leucine-rich repeat receptor-like serine/threonine-protein kinase At2g14510 [Daucus carota subsp. sativus]|uniref:leucine-rich repeat receptor-like serine/threonine-protein kinase At2g14510 n=1 Tax=Daucus carota subsp. sativus TaxID=79200 RepID=UPI003082EB09
MKKIGWIFLVSLALQLLSSSSRGPDTSRWQSIDCGSERSWEDRLLTWRSDYDYSQTGWNKLVGTNTTRDEFNTLRAFPNGSKDDCYNVPIDADMVRYIIRVGFYYGNYDGLSKPPTFDLFINNKKWTTINTSLNEGEPFYEEIIYPNKGSEFFKICLVQIQDGGIPFINSIETVGIFHTLYYEMDTNATYNLVTRINFGGPEVRYHPLTDERFNRIWSKGYTTYANVSGLPTIYAATSSNYPPESVMADAIESNASDPITLTIDLPQFTPQSAFIVLYIPQLVYTNKPNQTRSLKIEIDGKDQGTADTIGYNENTVVTKYPVTVSGPTINITLSRVNESSLPPMIAAMEVFTKLDMNVSAAAPEYFSFACSLILLFMLLSVA